METGTECADEGITVSRPTYIVGIDLGTTNCALAAISPALGPDAPVIDFVIPQLQRPGEVAARPLLPASLYIPGEHELPTGATRLPWGESPRLIAGEFARWQGARVPGRLVSSAKSWLCHGGVDRSAPILPWGAPSEVSKVSPVEASALLLRHLVAAWNFAHPEAPLAAQEAVITVPASFDEVARTLTIHAARQAGLEKFTLVEEPQAAFYAFVARRHHKLNDALRDTRLVLVVDVGGGTTDFTLIHTRAASAGLALRRIAVGSHLLLGGDNMDAALARLVEGRLLPGGRKLNAAQWTQLVQAARAAKESLLQANGPDRHSIGLAAEGSRLLGSTLSTELTREETAQLILKGFLPDCGPDPAPQHGARVALQELGLPYEPDPAITRHLAAFLRLHASAGFATLGELRNSSGLARPDALLLNGGVFNSPRIIERLVDVVSSWWPKAPRLRLLAHDSLELAVARGAAYHGLARLGTGHRIGGGAAHAFYVGLAAEQADQPPRAVCLIPRGHEDGQPVDLNSRPFQLMLGRPVQFPLYSTTLDHINEPGEIVEISPEMTPLPPLHTLLQSTGAKTAKVPVHLRATLTELGTLELWCVANNRGERWRLEFELRGAPTHPAATVTESMPVRFGEARSAVERVYGRAGGSSEPKEARQLNRNLEKIIGSRETWRVPWLRELWSIVYAGASKRRRSAEHERAFFQLVGYSLRPGFGYPLDPWRCAQTFRLFGESLNFHNEQPVWNEFWVMWRRMAGGLDETQQGLLWAYLQPHLARGLSAKASKAEAKMKGIQPRGLDEMVRTAASLEHLDPSEKAILGNWIIARLQEPARAGGPWAWALGRLGARVPLYGSGHKTVCQEQTSAWLSRLLKLHLREIEGAPFAAVQLARLTGDRTRDLDDGLRAQTYEELKKMDAPERWLLMVTQVVRLESTDEAQALGDTLPLGLQLP